jgi:hypothetical protein
MSTVSRPSIKHSPEAAGKTLRVRLPGDGLSRPRAETVVAEFKRQLDLEPGETTPDNEISFETVNCLGACALGPIVFPTATTRDVTKRGVNDIIEATRNGTLDRSADQRITGFLSRLPVLNADRA